MPDAADLAGELLSSDEGRAEVAVRRLAELGPQALAAVLPLCRAEEAEHRWWGLRAAASIPDRRSAEALAVALADREPSVRQAAALGLRLQPSAPASAALTQRLADPDALTARLASDALAAIGGAALPDLRRASANEAPAVRFLAIRALALMKEPSAVPDLFAALEDESVLVRHWAERGLEALGVGMVFFRAEAGGGSAG